jgi:glycosyltransferase involved in cell wall biosynthesis
MKALGSPIIIKKLSLYSIFGHTVLRSRVKNAVSKSFFPMYRSVIRGAVGADVESPTYVRWLTERFGIPEDRMQVIPNGANTELFRPMDGDRMKKELGLGDCDFIVGYVGALSRLRFVDTLIRSAGMLKVGRRVGCVIVGDGSERTFLEGVAREAGMSDRVRFVGAVPYSSVPKYMASFDVAADLTAVQMQVGGETMLASFSQKIAQYLASGSPVLAWDSLDTRFLAEARIGRVAPFGDEKGMAAAMTELLAVPHEERAATARRAREVAETEFSAAALSDRRMRLWESLTGV